MVGHKNKELVMDDSQVDRILHNPKFQEMVSKKRTLSWTLTAIMLVIYVGFMLLVGYNKEFLASSFSGGVTTWGMPLGLGIIVLSFVLCGVYSCGCVWCVVCYVLCVLWLCRCVSGGLSVCLSVCTFVRRS